MTDEEKNSMELDIEAKYVGRTEKEFLNTITYAECLYILDTKNKYCDDIKTLSLLKIVDIVNEQSKEIEELKKPKYLLNAKTGEITTINNSEFISKDKIKAKIEELDEVLKGQLIEKIRVYFEAQKEVLQSLLEKE